MTYLGIRLKPVVNRKVIGISFTKMKIERRRIQLIVERKLFVYGSIVIAIFKLIIKEIRSQYQTFLWPNLR